ncbi:MAG: 16S rRNA (adenine(1518)-N(6)/adenine(1519)-N(6))-dimethyltransferase RsmA, partial [Gammaproteobacteria bacterium]
VEIDRDIIARLRRRFDPVRLVVHEGDALAFDFGALIDSATVTKPGLRIVGNLPYNISTPLLVRLLRHLDRIVDMHFMLQREVAERLAAVPGSKDWGRLTVLTQYHATVEHLFDVGPDSFAPPPRVWSSVVRIRPRTTRSSTFPPALDAVLRHAFSQRRKRLSNALQSLPIDWSAAGVDPGKRADAVSVEEYVALAETLDPNALASTETASETDA